MALPAQRYVPAIGDEELMGGTRASEWATAVYLGAFAQQTVVNCA